MLARSKESSDLIEFFGRKLVVKVSRDQDGRLVGAGGDGTGDFFGKSHSNVGATAATSGEPRFGFKRERGGPVAKSAEANKANGQAHEEKAADGRPRDEKPGNGCGKLVGQ